MARNGSGTYSNPYPDFISGTVISSTEVDANNSDIATALTQSIAVDGQSVVTGDIPLATHKFTAMKVGTAATDSLSLGQAQAEAFVWCGTAGGSADAITLSPSPAITAYAAGQRFVWMASGSTNTGATTVAISGLGTIALQDNGAALSAGQHAAGKMFFAILDTSSTAQVMQVQLSGTDPLIVSSLTVSGDATIGDDLTLLSDASVLGFGENTDVTLTHVHDTGLLLNSTMQLQFSDSSQYINAPSATVLDINATDEIELNATLADVNANLDVSGTYQGGGTMTTGGNIVIPDAGNIGSASDTDAIAISSAGVVTMNQIPVFSAGINVSGGTIAGTLSTAAQGNITSLGTLTALTVDDVAVNGKVITMTGSSSDTAVLTAGTNGTLSIVTTDAAAAAANIQITADGTVDVDSAGVLTLDSGAAINLEPASGSAILLDGTISVDAGVVTGATSITSTAFVGDITGDVTGNTSGTAATVTTAAQPNITSLGTLTTLTVDNIIINGTNIGHTSDTDAIAIGADGDVTLTQDLELQHDGATISFGTNDDVTLTHVHDTGLLLNSTMQLQFSDASQYINAPSATVLDVNATDEIELNATLVDVNATLDVSGAAQFSSTVTVGVDDTGYDVKLFGATAGHYLEWDESADKLILYGELQTVTAGTSNLALGNGAGIVIESGGYYNTLVGDDAGNAITTADYNTAVGYSALSTNITGASNTAVGRNALLVNTASYNTAVGNNAMAANTSGTQNVAVGTLALDANTTADNNTAVGYSALGANITGANNTAVGRATLNVNTASDNTAVGNNALVVNTSGTQNVAVGANALDANTTASYNTALGHGALSTNISGASNTAVGRSALLLNTASSNTAVGASALYDATDATHSSALGESALANVTTGNSNTGIGKRAGYLITTGDLNTAVGAYSLDVETVGDRSTAIGYSALGSQVNTSNADIYNSACGYYAGKTITTGKFNTCMGGQSGGVLTTGSDNTYLGYNTDASAVDVTDEIVIGRDVVGGGTATARFGLGSNTATLGIDGSDTSWAAASDERLKTEIKASNAGLSFVNDLRPVTYQWKAQKDVPSEMSQHDPASDEPCKGTGKTHHGFVAQDVKRVIDSHELANGHNIWSEDPDGTQQIAPGNFMPMAIKAIQELSAKVAMLEATLQRYESK